ncbi:MAG: type II secretion system F family protein, partial [Planktomarina sp.]
MTATEIVLYVMLFIGILVLVEGLYLTMFGRSIAFNTRLNKRFSNLNRNHKRDAVMAQLRKDVSQKHTRANVPLMTHLADLAQKAGLAVTPQRLTTYMVLTATVLTLVLTFSTPLGILISLPIGVLAGFGGIYAWLSGAAHKRMNTMEEQLPDAVELMVRSLRVGHPFSATLAIVAAEMAEPLATEFSTISDEAVYGRDIPDALQDLATRLDLQDLRFLAVAISIQQQSGGNLSE